MKKYLPNFKNITHLLKSEKDPEIIKTVAEYAARIIERCKHTVSTDSSHTYISLHGESYLVHNDVATFFTQSKNLFDEHETEEVDICGIIFDVVPAVKAHIQNQDLLIKDLNRQLDYADIEVMNVGTDTE